jgi:integrase-like protein
MEFLSQYEATICYLLGNKNTVTNTLSHLPDTTIPTIATLLVAPNGTISNSCFALKDALLNEIKIGYESDPFTEKLTAAAHGMHNVRKENEFWFVNNQLFIPKVPHICESLFRITHDAMGHFGTDKSYSSLRDAFYWPGMHHNLETAYVPTCPDCQQNKASTTHPCSPLHPLPVPDK